MFKALCTRCIPLLAILTALSLQLRAVELSFVPGDVFVSLEPGPVQWHGPDGALRRVLVPTVPGWGEGMAFDASGSLHVARWCIEGSCDTTGNTVEKFNVLGQSMGSVGSNFNCNPHTIVFDAVGDAYVGQAGCNRTILKFVQTSIDPPLEYSVAQENQGVFWMDLAPDGCTMFYTSVGPNVKRFDVCTNSQLADFNAAPLPGGVTHDLRVLPDGGVLVSSGQVIARLDQFGVLSQTYEVPGETTLWAGLDLADNNTAFWAANYFSSNVHKFNLADGTRVAGFHAGTPPNTVVAVRVLKHTWQ
jgi:hypothetical protein